MPPTSPGTTGGIAEGAGAPVTLIRLSWATYAPPKRGYTVDDTRGGRLRRQRSGVVPGRLGLTISRSTGGGFLARMMVGVQASPLLLLLVGCATPNGRASGQQARDRQDIVVAHPQWPLGIRGAMVSGVISAGMTAKGPASAMITHTSPSHSAAA